MPDKKTVEHPLASMHEPIMLVGGDYEPQAIYEDLLQATAQERDLMAKAPKSGDPNFEAFTQADSYWGTGDPNDFRSMFRPYEVRGGVLTVPVTGSLTPSLSGTLSFATGYQYITAAVMRGADDPQVDAIVLLISSPGGLVDGCFECADAIAEVAARKSVKVHTTKCASAAYALAVSASEIAASRTAFIGSIGVMQTHLDYSQKLKGEGVKVTIIQTGRQKSDGHSLVPLTKEVEDRLAARANSVYDIFVEHVATHRPLNDSDIRALEGGIHIAKDAIKIGLADTTATLEEVMASVTANGEYTMSNPKSGGETQITAEDLATAVANAKAEASSEAKQKGFQEATARASAVMSSDEYKGREQLASTLLKVESMTAEAIVEALAQAPKAKAPEGGSNNAGALQGMDSAMSGQNSPQAGVEGETGGSGGSDKTKNPAATAKSIMADYSAMTGR